MSRIADIFAREVLDSRGTPTVEVEVILDDGSFGRADVPSGVSTGKFEAVELRDGDQARYFGRGVLTSVDHVNREIADALIGMDANKQRAIDLTLMDLDATPNKELLGASAILGVSLACARAAAAASKLTLYNYIGGTNAFLLPVPLVNVVSGGVHAQGGMDFQEYMIVPVGARSFSEALRWSSEVHQMFWKVLRSAGVSSVADDGGKAAGVLRDNEAPLEYMVKACEAAGYAPGEQIMFAIDAAASEFYDAGRGRYTFAYEGGRELSDEQMVDYWKSLVGRYPLISIEDGMAQEDWEGWTMLTDRIGENVQLVGDDLFVTNTGRLLVGIGRGAANAILISPNQVGTLTETLECIESAKQAGYSCVISHRTGETSDTAIADLAVAINAGQIKAGGFGCGDHMAKYNQLLRIEEELGIAGRYAGRDAFFNIDI